MHYQSGNLPVDQIYGNSTVTSLYRMTATKRKENANLAASRGYMAQTFRRAYCKSRRFRCHLIFGDFGEKVFSPNLRLHLKLMTGFLLDSHEINDMTAGETEFRHAKRQIQQKPRQLSRKEGERTAFSTLIPCVAQP